MGNSFGTYALYAAMGVLSEAEAYDLIQKRTEMVKNTESAKKPEERTGMIFIRDLEKPAAHYIFFESGLKPTNDNFITQVAGGTAAQISQFKKAINAQGIVVDGKPLTAARLGEVKTVIGAYHCSYRKEDSKNFGAYVDPVDFKEVNQVLYTTTSPEPLISPAHYYTELKEQMVNFVDFPRTLNIMLRDGVRMFLDMGPGKSLTKIISSYLDYLREFGSTEEKMIAALSNVESYAVRPERVRELLISKQAA